MPRLATVDEPAIGSAPSRASVQPVPPRSPAVIRASTGTSSATVLCGGNEMSTRAVGPTTVTRHGAIGEAITPPPVSTALVSTGLVSAVPVSTAPPVSTAACRSSIALQECLGLGDERGELLLAHLGEMAHGVVDRLH